MLRFLTQKLRSQSINEVQPFQPKGDEDHDSGTESDDEYAELDDLTNNLADRNQVDTSSYGSASPTHHPSSPLTTQLHDMNDRTTYAEVTWDNIGGASVFEHQNGFLDAHSSEEELDVINQDDKAEKRKWSQVSESNGVHPESAGSSDEEIRDLLQPQPIRFSSSPPSGVSKLQYAATPPKLFLANVATTFAVSPRKRHRQTSSVSDGTESEAEAVIQRPCLDFEKMQKTLVKKHCSHHGLGRAKIVKIRTLSGNGRPAKCLFDPAVFSFRSISTGYSPLMTPVEEPSCAY